MAAGQPSREYSRAARFAAALLLCACSSCDLVKPNDRLYNDAAQPPDVGRLDPALIRPGQHLAGIVTLEIDAADLPTLSSPVAALGLFVDSVVVSETASAPYVLSVDTRTWPEGPHTLAIAARETKPDIGLAGIAGYPSVVRLVDVVFDQSLPTPVTLTSVTWDGGVPQLTWTASSDSNFYAYCISREGNYGGNLLPPEYAPPGPKVFDRDSTSYRDASISGTVIGVRLDYRVHVSNRTVAAASNVVRLLLGDAVVGLTPDLSSSAGMIPPLVPSPTLDEFYVLFRDTLRAYSSVSQTELRRTSLRAPGIDVTSDGASIYATSYEPAFQQNILLIYSASTLALTTSRNMAGTAGTVGYALVAGRPDRAYLATYSELVAIDVSDGGTVGALQLPLSNNTRFVISPDANTLYAATTDSLYRIDVSTDAIAIVDRRGVTPSIADLQLSPDGARLYLGHVYGAPSNFVEILDAASFSPVGQLAAPSDQQLFGFWVTASHLYLSQSRSDPNGIYFLPGRVVQYDRLSLAQVRSWDFVQVPRWVSTSRDEQWFYAEGFETWVVAALSSAPFFSRN
jgi:hypothetical protein